MSSPTKKRKLNKDTKAGVPTRSLEYYFSKQKQAASAGQTPASSQNADAAEQLTADEKLARRLQTEWNQADELAGRSVQETQSPTRDHAPPDVKKDGVRSPAPGPSTSVPDTTQKAAKPNVFSLQTVSADEDRLTSTIPLDESPLTFRPSDYTARLQQLWATANNGSRPGGGAGAGAGGDASYALLTRCFVLVAGTTSRIRIVDTLTNTIRLLVDADPSSLLPMVWLSTNSISPPWVSLELGLGGSAISRALRSASGLDAAALKALWDRYGDAGDVAFEAGKRRASNLMLFRRPRPLTIKGVYASLVKIANTKGPGSSEAKQRIVETLVRDAREGEEWRYIIRTLCCNLRIGAVRTTMLIALARAFMLSRPSGATFPVHDPAELAKKRKEDVAMLYSRAEETVKACFARRPDYNALVPALLEIGVVASDELLARCGTLVVHTPLRPMLGAITRDLGEMFVRLGTASVQGDGSAKFACEFKYDGQRAQVHCDEEGRVSIFSRHLENMTEKYPDLVALVPSVRGEGVQSFILEGEVVAIDRETGELKDFQTLANRARKDVVLSGVKVNVCLFAFDLMLLNGTSLLDRSFRERRDLLRSMFVEKEHRFSWVKSLDATTDDAEAVQEFFRLATRSRCEGIMVKILDNVVLRLSGTDADGDNGAGEEADEEPAKSALSAKATQKSKAKSQTKSKAAAVADSEKKAKSRRKPLLATYEPDKRLESWLKVKKDYASSAPGGGGPGDTLDLVPIGAWHGMGRKSRWWSPILLAVRNERTGTLEAVCKCMSGFTDKFYKEMRAFYDDGSGEGDPTGSGGGGGASAANEEDHSDGDSSDEDEGGDEDEDGDAADDSKAAAKLTRQNNRYANTRRTRPSFVEYRGPEPDVWFEPREVWEVAFADVTLSPTYTAALGLVSDERGLSLRFPRFLRTRPDKSIDDASTSDLLASLFRRQEARGVAVPVEEEQ